MDDSAVKSLSTALQGKQFDWVVSGSIAAVEVVKAIRALRRLGASVRVTLTTGGQQFITAESCAWASGQPVITSYRQFGEHLATKDFLVIAPMSASFTAKIVAGISDSPGLALVASYLGCQRPIVGHLNMHRSLHDNPLWQRAIVQVQQHVHLIEPTVEEGKHKFKNPTDFANDIAHFCNKANDQVLITMGRTEGYLDEVRYLSNTSTGQLATLIAHELYRHGFATHIVRGPSDHYPSCYTSMTQVKTPDEMGKACQGLLNDKRITALVMTAAVLDFIPTKTVIGKISSQQPTLKLKLVAVPKLVKNLNPTPRTTILCKLLATFDPQNDLQMIRDYLDRTPCSLLIVNSLADLREKKYRSYLFCPDLSYSYTEGRTMTAQQVCQYLVTGDTNKIQ